MASTLLCARRKAEPPAPAAGTRRGPALRAAAAASSRSGCPSVTGNLLALAARGAGGALRPPRAPGRGAGAAGARRESPQQGRAPPPPARHPRLRGSLRGGRGGARTGPARSDPHRALRLPRPESTALTAPHRPWDYSGGGCISDVWGWVGNCCQLQAEANRFGQDYLQF